jgi:hypothetical protein
MVGSPVIGMPGFVLMEEHARSRSLPDIERATIGTAQDVYVIFHVSAKIGFAVGLTADEGRVPGGGVARCGSGAAREARLKRLYDAIEAGVADLNDPALKDRIDGLKAIRDQAKADAERAQAMLENSGSKAVTRQMVRTFAETARRHIRLEGGGYRRDHLRALAQRVEVADGEVRIMGSSPGCYRG